MTIRRMLPIVSGWLRSCLENELIFLKKDIDAKFKYMIYYLAVHVAGWLNWLERPVHTREVESSSLSSATKI